MSKKLQEVVSKFLINEKKEEYVTNDIILGLFSDRVTPNIDYVDGPSVKCDFPVEKNTFNDYK